MLQRVAGLEDEEMSLAPHGRVPALDGPLGGSWTTIVVGLFTIVVGFLVVVYFFWKVERLQFHLPFPTLEMGPRSSASEPEPEDAAEVFEDGFFEAVPLPTDASLCNYCQGPITTDQPVMECREGCGIFHVVHYRRHQVEWPCPRGSPSLEGRADGGAVRRAWCRTMVTQTEITYTALRRVAHPRFAPVAKGIPRVEVALHSIEDFDERSRAGVGVQAQCTHNGLQFVPL